MICGIITFVKKIHKLVLSLLLISLILPNLAFASWWNPFSWSVFHKPIKTEVIKVATSTVATSTIAKATSTVDMDTIIKAKVDAQVKAIIKAKSDEDAKIVQQQNEDAQSKIDAAVKSALDKQAAQIAQGQANQNTISKPLETTSSATASIYTDLKNPSSASGIVTMIPVIIFDVRGQNDTLHLHSLTVHFNVSGTAQNVSGTAQITNAYLYQGNTTPISSALVSGNTATFLIPDNTTGANFGANIPSQFTVKVDTVGTHLIYSKDDSPFSISSSINSSDIQVYDSSDNLVPVTGSATGGIRISSGYCGPGCA